jgi:hypothetical protein
VQDLLCDQLFVAKIKWKIWPNGIKSDTFKKNNEACLIFSKNNNNEACLNLSFVEVSWKWHSWKQRFI